MSDSVRPTMPLPPIDTHDPAEMADLIAAFRAESLANERLIDKLETQVQRLTMDLDYEISARKAAEQALGELPHENETLRFALHAAEMRNRDYADGTAIQEMAQEIGELQAELAALPKWTRITDDPATWPPDELVTVSDKAGYYWIARLEMKTQYDIDTQVGLWYLRFEPWKEEAIND